MNTDCSINKSTETSQTLAGSSFSSLAISDILLKNLATLDYQQMTPIQAASLPLMLQGDDVIAQAKTGSGKTAAFGLSLLNQLQVDHYAIQGLILCPTRELAEQAAQVLRRLARLMPNVKVLNLSGGIPMKPQLDSLRHGAHIIVGTPGRVLKHLSKDSLSLRSLKCLILDEADRMLDMGFFDSIKDIINNCPKKRQTLLFSATYPKGIQQLASEFLIDPKRVKIEEENELAIEQRFYEVTNPYEKFPLLKALLHHYKPQSALIFCNTKDQTSELSTLLAKEGFSTTPLNGDMEQVDRDLAIIRFTHQSTSILVATDVAARGLDIKELPAVINYDLAFEPEVHLHRIGRTGRAGNNGLALSLTTAADAERLIAIEEELKRPLVFGKQGELSSKDTSAPKPGMVTFCLNAGRKDKIRPGDILGALTKDAGLPGALIGKIDIFPQCAYVSIAHSQAEKAFHYLKKGKLKGRNVSVKRL